MLARNMGRKPLPKSEVRRVISVSLKPATITALDRMRGDTARSRWVEEMIEHLLPIHEGFESKPIYQVSCESCLKGWIINSKMDYQKVRGYNDRYHCPRCHAILIQFEEAI